MVASLALLCVALAACDDPAPASRPSSSVTSPVVVTTTTVATTTTTTTTTPPAPVFRADVQPADATRLTSSWRVGCPVPIEDLRLVRLAHWGFDGAVHDGELVVHVDVADDVVRAFDLLFAAAFPIERMQLVDDYGGDDDASMAANNTSAFNCRPVSGTSRWSEHAYGRAIDLNPVQNPYVRGRTVEPDAGRAYLDRGDVRPGMLVGGGPAVDAFRSIGWGWGGDWRSAKDHQHVSATGR